MRLPLKTIFFVVLLVVLAFSFRQASGRVLDWLKAMHGGPGQAAHGSK